MLPGNQKGGPSLCQDSSKKKNGEKEREMKRGRHSKREGKKKGKNRHCHGKKAERNGGGSLTASCIGKVGKKKKVRSANKTARSNSSEPILF